MSIIRFDFKFTWITVFYQALFEKNFGCTHEFGCKVIILQ